MKTEDFYKKIKKGDILYESQYGYTIEIKVISDPVFEEIPEDKRFCKVDEWRVKFTATSGRGDIDYCISPVGLAYNVGRLSKLPEYTGELLKIDGTKVII